MIDYSKINRLLVSCPARITPILRAELQELGYSVHQESDTFVETSGTMNDVMILNLYLRTAHRVLYHLYDFTASNPKELYDGFSAIAWEDYFSVDEYISISSHVEHPDVNDSRFPNMKAKDAIVDRFRKIFGRRPDSGSERKGVMIYFYWVNQKCSVFFDMSGTTLTKRNYRKIPYKAPMQEALAAAVLLAAEWKGNGNFINPMCGSGTLAIEAAMIALNKVPGLHRSNFSFMHLKGYDEEAWKNIRNEARRKSVRKTDGKIIASDISSDAVSAALQNARTAGVDHLIDFRVCDFRETEVPQDSDGIVMLNPEYGERLGEIRQLEEIYSSIGDFFKQKCMGYTGYVFTGNLDLAKKIGLKAQRRIPFYNGKIDCRLLKYELYLGSRKAKYQNSDQ